MNSSDLLRKAAADAAALLFADSTIRLYQNDFAPDPMSPLGAFTIASFHGYANIDNEEAVVVRDQLTNDWEIVLASVPIFVATAGAPLPQTVYGVYVVDTAGTGLLASRRFDTPYTFSAAGDGLVLDILKLTLPVTGIQ